MTKLEWKTYNGSCRYMLDKLQPRQLKMVYDFMRCMVCPDVVEEEIQRSRAKREAEKARKRGEEALA